MKKILALLIVVAAACNSRNGSTRPTVRIAVGGQAQFIYLPLTLADQLGYFKDEGVTISISDLKGGSEALAALIGGSVDMVAGFYEHTVRAQVQGKALRMVALFDRYPGMVLMVGHKHSSQIHSIADLIGHPVGVTAAGSSTDQMLKYILRGNGFDPQSIPVVTAGTTTMVAAFEQDHIWAGVTVDPLATKLEADGTAAPLYDTRTEEGTRKVFGGPWPAGGIYATSAFVEQNPEIVRSVVRAAVRALQYIQSHQPEDIASQMPESFLAGGRDQYIRSLRANIGMFTPDGVMPAEGPANVLKTLALVDPAIAAGRVNLETTYDNSFVARVAR